MFPRKVGSGWEILAPAKLNLYLEVIGPRAEGFHPLETLMVPVRIFDQLRWTENLSQNCAGGIQRPEKFEQPSSFGACSKNLSADPGPKLQICDLRAKCDLPGDLPGKLPQRLEDNLVLRAAESLAHAAGVEPRGVFRLVKRIPIEAGLGGGSSDAAAALLLANACWNIRYSRQRLSQLAADLGSDVPFFLSNGAAVCRGRGEQVEPVAGLPRLHFVIVKPPVGLSTPEVFHHLEVDGRSASELISTSATRLASLIDALRRGGMAEAGPWMANRLEGAAQQLSPWIARLRSALAESGCWGCFMTGSGAAYVAVMRSARQARRIARSIAGMNLGNVFATSNC